MTTSPTKPFWHIKPAPQYDISRLKPPNLAKTKRFETLEDARTESERSERLIRSARDVSLGGNRRRPGADPSE